MSNRSVRFVTLIVVLLITGCAEREATDLPAATATTENSKLLVYVVNDPLKYFAERIGGDLVQVEFPAPPDVDPAFWSPDAATIVAYQQADLILLNGAGYAAWVDRVTLPASKLVDTSAAFRDRYIVVEDAGTHNHGPGAEHSHGEIAFTTWLDPQLALQQARAIREAFAAAMPDREAVFQEGFDSLEHDLRELDQALLDVLSRNTGRPLLASHPVYQYLARRYALNLESVHFEPDEYPDETSWQGLEELLTDHPATWMLWEGAPLEESAAKLRKLGVASLVFDPRGNAPDERDFLTVMKSNVSNLEQAFQ